MRRREFISGILTTVAWPLVARAQQQTLPVIGFVNSASTLSPCFRVAERIG